MSKGKKKKNFFRHGGDKRKTRVNADPLQKEIWDLPWAMEKLKGLTFFFFFCPGLTNHTTQLTEGRSRSWENKEVSAVEDQIWQHLRNLKAHKSMGSDDISMDLEGTGRWSGSVAVHPFQEVMAAQWSSHWLETKLPFLKRWKRKDLGTYNSVTLTLVPCKIMEQIPSRNIAKSCWTQGGGWWLPTWLHQGLLWWGYNVGG